MKALFDKECNKSFYKVVDLSIDENNTMYLTVKIDKNGKMLKQCIFTNVTPVAIGNCNIYDSK